jgi:glutathione S-transferase
MKLYYSAGACSLAVHIALREVGAKFETHAVDLAKHTLADGSDYYRISPRGYVPLLEFDDGTRRTEVAALLQYVADLDPRYGMIGRPGSARRLDVLEWTTFVSTELHKTFSWLWYKDLAESTRDSVKSKLATRFAELDVRLATNAFLAGEYSIADAYAFTIVNWSNFLGFPLARYPNLRSYLDRVAGRPRVREALESEGLVKRAA